MRARLDCQVDGTVRQMLFIQSIGTSSQDHIEYLEEAEHIPSDSIVGTCRARTLINKKRMSSVSNLLKPKAHKGRSRLVTCFDPAFVYVAIARNGRR